MSTTTDTTILTYQNNQPTFTDVKTNTLLMARDKSLSGLSLPSSTDTTKQYVVKVNTDGNYYFDNFTVTTDMEVTQAPNQWDLHGTDNTKLAANGILISADNGANAYTIDIQNSGFVGLRYNTTQKKIVAQSIYQGPKDWLDSSGNRLAANGIVLSTNSGEKAKILPVTGNNTYGLMLNTSSSEPELIQINNHSHTCDELYVCKYQTTSDTSEDSCVIQTTSKPYYIVNWNGSKDTVGQSIPAGTYLINLDLDIECLDMTVIQKSSYSFNFGLGSVATHTITTDNKVANRLNLHYSFIYTQASGGPLIFTIGRATIEKAYKWCTCKITLVKVSN